MDHEQKTVREERAIRLPGHDRGVLTAAISREAQGVQDSTPLGYHLTLIRSYFQSEIFFPPFPSGLGQQELSLTSQITWALPVSHSFYTFSLVIYYQHHNVVTSCRILHFTMRFSITATLFALASSVLAEDSPRNPTAGFDAIMKPAQSEKVPAGSTYDVIWDYNAGNPSWAGTITLSLLGGDNPATLSVLNVIASEFSWCNRR